MKKSFLLILMLGLLLLCAACAPQPSVQPPAPEPSAPQPEPPAAAPQATVEIKVAALKGPSGACAAYLLEQAEQEALPYSFTLCETPEQAVALLANGGVDMAFLPTNLAANLYAKTDGEIIMAAISAYGSLYLLQAGDSVSSWEDLRGRTIYATGRGANPEYILDYLLRAGGLIPEQDVFVEFKSEHAELATLLAAGEVDLAMLPEPFVTTALLQNSELNVIFDLSESWQQSGAGNLAMTCLAVRREFAEAEPQALAAFLDDMESSIEFTLDQVAEAAALCEKHGIIPKAAVAERAIPRFNLHFVTGAAMKDTVAGYYQVLFDANPQAVGGALPDDEFYYIPR